MSKQSWGEEGKISAKLILAQDTSYQQVGTGHKH